jgi:IclR family KDG regulon transcriptional repressor
MLYFCTVSVCEIFLYLPVMKSTLRPNQSTTKVLSIIEVMAESNAPLKVKDLSARLSMPGATVIRFLQSLINEGYVIQEKENSRYFLTMKICQLGEQVNSRFNLREAVHPFLVELMEKCEESTCLAVDIDKKTTYIDAVEGPSRVLRTLQRIGKSAPLHSTGVGKNLLLNYSEKDIDKLVSDDYLVRLTENTITSKKRLLAELEKVRSQGFAMDDEECEIGVRCVAAPIYDFHGKVVASISASGPASRLKDERLQTIKNDVINSAKLISGILSAK